MSELQSIGVAAALSLPQGQRGEQNRESKTWTLIAPDGTHHTVVNLLHWARSHYKLFEPDSLDAEATAQRIRSGFGAIASSMRGVKSRRHPISSYKGWGLYEIPEKAETGQL